MDLENTAQDYLAKVVGSKKKDPVVWTIYLWLSTKSPTSRGLSRCIVISFTVFCLILKTIYEMVSIFNKYTFTDKSTPLRTKVHLYGQKYTSTDTGTPLLIKVHLYWQKYTFNEKNTHLLTKVHLYGQKSRPLLTKVHLYWQMYTSTDKSTPLLTKVQFYLNRQYWFSFV